MSLDFLLEIGTEEIPHWMIPGALAQLAKLELFGADSSVDATPRRLVVRASGIPERTPDREQAVKGPPVASGDKAAEGFAKKQGADPSALRKAGNYYELVKSIPGRAVRDMLAESLPGAILGLQWPKTMFWTGGKTGPRFIRPIRWIVALLADEVIPFEIAGVKSGNVTRGHRRLGSSSIPVTIASYESDLRKNFVILSSHERRHKIETEAAKLGAKIDHDLLETLTFITEYPTAIRGDFDPAYLELPAEVLTTVMRHHQKYFSVDSQAEACATLAPHFVAVMNTAGDPDDLVKKGNERVLRARFNDARFFWNVDQHKKLIERVDDLANVTFQAKLGSYEEKAKRMQALVGNWGGNQDAYRAALLCKCDLTTEMVKEFTDLQGIVGGLYAKKQGESAAVADAIYHHYKPLSMDDEVPPTREGLFVALADKLDTLRECFRIGLIPTGSKDPFALRRAAQGVVKILATGEIGVGLSRLAPSEELREFLRERIQHYFREVRGYKYDEVNAIMKVRCDYVPDVEERLDALAAIRPTENFEPLAASFRRIGNILKQANFNTLGPVNTGLLEPGPEQDLYADSERVRTAIQGTSDRKKLEEIATLRPRVDLFFDKVMVNAKEENVRFNRLQMLKNILTNFSTIADFSEIVTAGDQK